MPLFLTVRWIVTRSPSGVEPSGPAIVTSMPVVCASVSSPSSGRLASVAGALSVSGTPSATSGSVGVESGSRSAVSLPEVNVVSSASAPASVGGVVTIALETSGSVPRSASSGRVPIDLVARARGVAVPLEGAVTERRGATGSGWGRSPSGRGMFASAFSSASRIGRRTIGGAGRRAGWRGRAGAATPTGVGSATNAGFGMAVSSAVVATSDGTSAESSDSTSTSPAPSLSAVVGEVVAPPSSPLSASESRSSSVVGSASSEGAAVTIRASSASPLASCATSASPPTVEGVAFGSVVSATATASTAAGAGAAAGRPSFARVGAAGGARRSGVRLACIEGRGAGTRPSARGMFSSRAWRRSSGVITGWGALGARRRWGWTCRCGCPWTAGRAAGASATASVGVVWGAAAATATLASATAWLAGVVTGSSIIPTLAISSAVGSVDGGNPSVPAATAATRSFPVSSAAGVASFSGAVALTAAKLGSVVVASPSGAPDSSSPTFSPSEATVGLVAGWAVSGSGRLVAGTAWRTTAERGAGEC